MVHISQCLDVLAFPCVPWQHLTSPVMVSVTPPVTEMVLKVVPCGLFPSALQATMCFLLPQGSVTARCRSRLHLPTTWKTAFSVLPLCTDPHSASQKLFDFLFLQKALYGVTVVVQERLWACWVWVNPNGSVHLNSKRKKPFYAAKARYFRLWQVWLNELEFKIWSSFWGFPVGFPLQDCRWLYRNRGKINNSWDEREESVLRKSEDGWWNSWPCKMLSLGSVPLNMEERITGCGYNRLVIFKMWRGSMLNIPLNWRSNFSSKLWSMTLRNLTQIHR